MLDLVKLDFPEYKFRLRQTEKSTEIFDIIRKKFVALTPEEWVRQHTIHFLKKERQMPFGRMNVEVTLQTLQLSRRADIVVFDNAGKPIAIVECKAPTVKITQDVFDQIARYNMALNASYLIVTNGLIHFCCYIDLEKRQYHFLEEIPIYREITGQ
jgi:type I site-specific restriction endonuclease